MIELEVFPNTGHQFFHVPLRSVAPKKSEDELKRFVQKNRGPWAQWSEFTPWLLFQYASETSPYTGEETHIIKLAVETNLGLPERGLLFGVEKHEFKDGEKTSDAYKRYEAYEKNRSNDGIIYPYASIDKAKLWEDYPSKRLFLDHLASSLPVLRRSGADTSEPIPLPRNLIAVHWKKPAGADPVDVDLAVDLGNTRTVALLLENPGQEQIPLGRRVKILRFIPRGCPFTQAHTLPDPGKANDDFAIIDSWLILHRPIFASREPPLSEEKVFEHWESESASGGSMVRVQHLPQTFVELSPALIGGGKAPEGAARILAQVRLDTDARFSLSSPKRYAWDEELVGRKGGTYWKQIPNDTDAAIPDAFDDLRGLFRYFMDPGGVDWDFERQPTIDDFRGKPMVNSPSEYPRRDAICWFALSIIENAFRQINSAGYLAMVGRESLPRRLRQIRVTYPSGWTWEEQSKYLAQWQRAIDLFALTHLADPRPISLTSENGGEKPVLAERALDEAVCSQLPVLYSDITFLGGDGENWFETYGNKNSTTVMNVDIGGGTTDISVIRYNLKTAGHTGSDRLMGPRGTTAIQSTLLFRDGNSIAGDMLVKRIVEKVLLPCWLRSGGLDKFEDNSPARRALLTLLKSPAAESIAQVDPKASTKLVRIVRLVFIPLVNHWLQQLTLAEAYPDSPRRPLVIRDLVHPDCVNELNELVLKVIISRGDHWGNEENLLRLRDGRHFAEWYGRLKDRDEVPFPIGAQLQADASILDDCIGDVFEDMFASLGLLVAREKCDLVVVSGKPSELPHLRKLILRNVPILPQRIIQVKNFPAGEWYPFVGDDGIKINDAKTCTVAGAALYQDILNGNLKGFSVEQTAVETYSKSYFWGIMGNGNDVGNFYKDDSLLFRPGDYASAKPYDQADNTVYLERDFPMPLNCRIGRQIKKVAGVRPEPVYRLEWTPSFPHDNSPVFARVRLRWLSTLGKGERLEIARVTALQGQPFEVDPSEVRLKLNTLLGETFWLDEPHFDADGIFNA